QAAVLIAPNSRAILRQDAPASSLMYTSPNRLKARRRLASAGCVARPHMVALGCVGRGRGSQALPGLPKIRGAEHVPLLASSGFSTSGEKHLRIISLDGDTPGIG